MFIDRISSKEDAVQQKVLNTIPVTTYRFCDLANHKVIPCVPGAIPTWPLPLHW
jgi:hypothetical protein